MVRQIVASWWLASFIAADIVFIGAAGMWPKPQAISRNQVVVVALEPPPAPPEEKPAARAETGVASWYGDEFQGRITASGKPFDDRKLTAAHRTLPLNTRARVTNLETGRSVEVKVNDRGPYINGRVIDLSTRAAEELGMTERGLARVEITALPEQTASSTVE